MKKLLTALLSLCILLTLASGCSPSASRDPAETPDIEVTPSPEEKEFFINEKPQYSDEKDEDGLWKDVITFNVFNTEDYQTRWSDYSKQWMLQNFHIKVGYIIPGISGFTDTWNICQNKLMEDPFTREEYRAKLVSLFIAEKTRPDYLPSLYSSCIAADGAWFSLEEYLVDLAPYVAEGGSLYDGYVKWLWGDKIEYWEEMKTFLMNDLEQLFAIPRREMMPVQNYLGYSTTALEMLGVSWEDKPQNWNDFYELLLKYKGIDDSQTTDGGRFEKASFRTNEENGADLIEFIATTYGLDFNADFSWTTKNGEPLWTYYWDEYLEILKIVNMLAAEGLVLTNAEEPDYIANYTLDKSDAAYKATVSGQNEAGAFSGIAGYARADKIAWWTSNVRGTNKWTVSDTWISQAGYEYSLVGGSNFDSNYLAIGNLLGNEFTNRIIDFWNYSLSDEGYLRYQFGKEGLPFADTLEEAGNYIFDEDGKLVFTNHSNFLPFVKDDSYEWWAVRDEDWWQTKSPYYEKYIAGYDGTLYGNVAAGDGTTVADHCGITDTKVWENDFDQFRCGTWFYADVTEHPYRKTAYWYADSMSKYENAINQFTEVAKANNSVCYKGFFRSARSLLGKNWGDMTRKINNLQALARDFTLKFLSGEANEAGWTNYIKSLQEAGYQDVYDFYCNALYGCMTSYREDVFSQSETNSIQESR